MVYRDHRTILLSVVLPVALMPILLMATQTIHARKTGLNSDPIFLYEVTGGNREELKRLINVRLSDRRFKESQSRDSDAALARGDVDFVLIAESLEETRERVKTPSTGTPSQTVAKSVEQRLPGVPVVRIAFRADQDRSVRGYREIDQALADLRNELVEDRLKEEDLVIPHQGLFATRRHNLATDAEVTGATVGPYVTAFLVLLLLGGGSVAAMDILAGEKERGSMETLLTCAARREEIVWAKQATVLLVAVVIALIQVINVLFYVTFRLIELPQDFKLVIPPLAVVALLAAFIPLAALLAAVLLAVSGRTSSYKEAQLLYFPVFVVCVVLALAGVLPEVTSRSAICLVPIANTGVAVKEIFVGRYDWLSLLVGGLVNLGLGGWLVAVTTRLLTSEELVTQGAASGALDSFEHFSRRVLYWYAVLAAALLVIPPNVEVLAGLTGQVLFNQLVLFGLVPVGIVWAYRLKFREALALRSFHPAVWLAIVLMIPGSQLTATGFSLVLDKVLPMPKSMAEEMAKLLVPESLTLGWLVLFLAVLPGIFEELAFRGVLLYGLHRRFRPIALCLVVGLVFGAFHMSIYRILPTGLIGVLLTAVALSTGSILPGMLIHIGNNALGVIAYRFTVDLGSLPPWVYLLGVALQALAFYILYRHRTPYPDLLDVRKT